MRRCPLAARLTLAGRNLVTWSGYRGADPEVGTGRGPFGEGVDALALPVPRYVTARLSATW